MDTLQIPLDGVLTTIKREKIPIQKIVLDVTNPRIQYYLDTRLNENISQDQIRLALAESNGQYDKLKYHIKLNKGIYNPIWVVPKGDYFRVIEGKGKVERVCVKKAYRKKGVGKLIMNTIEEYAKTQNITHLVLSAQLTALPFYQKLGYQEYGDVFLDANIEHKMMDKRL